VTRFYAGELPEAYADALAAVRAAEQVGHHRAATIGCHIVFFTAIARGEAAIARQYVDRALDLSRQLGARRFEAEALWFHGEILRREGRLADALAAIREALGICRETGMSYIGPAILGALAHATDREEERHAALAEAEQLLAQGSISHNHLWFYQDAIETLLEHGGWEKVERYAQALADYMRPEPLPFLEVIIGRGRALAAFGRDPHCSGALRELEQAHERAEAIGWLAGLPALDAAIAASATR
jgi:tetratricopeptide (TPR) repeat protein